MAEAVRDLAVGLEEAKEAIAARARERGFITSDELLEGISTEDFTPEQIEDFLAQVEEHLRSEGLEVIEVTGQEVAETTPMRAEVDPLKAPTNDPVRMYLKEIGRVALLTAAQEIDLARRIEVGEMVTNLTDRNDPKTVKRIVEFVIGVKKHQEDAFGRLEGAGREPVTKTWKPKSNADRDGFLRRVERDGQLAKRKLIEANLRLVVSIAKRYVGRGMLFLDLIQEGNLGLIRAVEKFDYRKGFKFSTYATWWIRQAITRAIADQARTIRIPVHMVETINKLTRIQRQLLQDLGREPTADEIGHQMGITAERVREIQKVSQEPVSLDLPIGEEEDSHLGDFIEDADAVVPSDAATYILLQENLEQVISTLQPREALVILLRFGMFDVARLTPAMAEEWAKVSDRYREKYGMEPNTIEAATLEVVGSIFLVTRERIRQIESKTLSKLRHPSRSQKLRDYLED